MQLCARFPKQLQILRDHELEDLGHTATNN